MIDESNPAGRLHKILKKAKSLPDNEKVKSAWAKALSIEGDEVDITKAVIELYSLSQEIQSLIKMNDSLNHDLYLSSFNQIERAFFPLNLANPWQNSKRQLTDEALTRLQFCAQELSRFYKEESLSKEELDDIIARTDELFEALYSSALPDALRLSLLEEIQRIRNAIAQYKIRGAKGLKEALQGTIGAVYANQVELAKASDTEKDVIERLGKLIDKIDSFTAKALKIHKIIRHPIKFILEQLDDDSVGEDET
ncbi:hypothetical protein [Alteromonas mediterranea]|uniref:Uncharacterized protein n=1 Tax=Alteromonas mediterranea TaxID=314275 RepID=A0AAC8XKE7_9ALTE|nr:hypothetical protein [Alteromonas mediterranea]AFV85515.1 hypothetical protein amad1_10040 [Alteromonas mediterranea DE1]AGP97528.1 hypothetical protein I635_10030 [Alteromonas mediterranea UM7]AGQ00744.1 hypothetical protein I636_04380 [Alteromonas mediterranea UM4b]AMJ78581.1 hypothetical protein AV942_09915 [Alteromonas mediterranea]AMJ82731.1 hypothetical protein AV941_09950 [Alteromonas mediterranea]